MTSEILLLLTILAGMIFLFITQKVPVDVTSVAGLVLLTLLGYVGADEAFIGFSSPAVITMLSTFFLGAALRLTGVAGTIATWMNDTLGSGECMNLIAVMLISALLSSVMNNVAATAVLLPAVVSLAQRAEIAPSRLLIPLSFGTCLGGTTTLIGTNPNILIGDLMLEDKVKPFGLFDFTPFGLVLVVLGTVYMAFIGRHFLPKRDVSKHRRRRRDLPKLYKLHDRLLSVQLPKGSALAGETLESAHFGDLLDSQVLAVIRGGTRHLAPEPGQILQEEDVLIVRGKLDNLELLLKFRKIEVAALDEERAKFISKGMASRGLQLIEEGVVGWSLKDLNFRKRYGLVVAAIHRGDISIHRGLANEELKKGDVIQVIGTPEQFDATSHDPYFRTVDADVSEEEFLRTHLFSVKIEDDSPLIDMSVRGTKMSELLGLTVVGIVRGEQVIVGVQPQEKIRSGDQLLVAGNPEQVLRLSRLSDLVIDSREVSSGLESKEIGIMEAVLSPRSTLIDQTLKQINFREKYGLQVLAIWREGRPIRSRLALDPLQFGDALLLQGSRKKMPLVAEDPDFVVLSDEMLPPRRTSRAIFAILGLVIMMSLVILKIQPVHVAAFTGAVFVVITGALKMEEAYREIEWRVIFLIACLIPIGIAMKDSGAASYIAQGVVSLVGGYGPFAVVIALSILSSLLSQTLDNTLTVILLAPIGIQTANSMGISPYPILMAIAISASIAFLTPFSHKAHLLVMGAGGYRVKDYFRVGLPLTIICFAALWATLAVLYKI